jgi:hypothetical protein
VRDLKPLTLFTNKPKGLVERCLTFRCRPAIKDNLYSIKEITINPPGDPEKQELYGELMNFRRLMLCYRLIHYSDHIPDIDTGLKNRDNELGGPLMRLFHDTKVFDEIKDALKKFLAQRKAKKEKTMESALGPLIVKLLTENNTMKLPVGLIWNEAINTIPGRLNPQKPSEYQTNEYGTLYRNTLPQKVIDTIGAFRERNSDGSVLIFD